MTDGRESPRELAEPPPLFPLGHYWPSVLILLSRSPWYMGRFSVEGQLVPEETGGPTMRGAGRGGVWACSQVLSSLN